jgi:hypothetical protein
MNPYAKVATLVLRLAAVLFALRMLVTVIPVVALAGGARDLALQLALGLAAPAALAAASRPLGALLGRGLE